MLTLPYRKHNVIKSYRLSNVHKDINTGEDVSYSLKNRIRIRFRIKNILSNEYTKGLPIKVTMSGGWNYGDFCGYVTWLFYPERSNDNDFDLSKFMNIEAAANACVDRHLINSINIDVGLDKNNIDHRIDIYLIDDKRDTIWYNGFIKLEPYHIRQYSLNMFEIELTEFTNDLIDKSKIPQRVFTENFSVLAPLSQCSIYLNNNDDPSTNEKRPNINAIKYISNLPDNNSGGDLS